MPKKVTDPRKQTTDPVLLSCLARAGIDKRFVEFVKDYGKRGPGCSPYSKRYRDRKSGKNFLVVSGLPMCRADGTKLTPGWARRGGRFHAKTNLFTGTIEYNGRIALSPTNNQPNGMRTSDTLAWNPQIYLGGIEVSPVVGPTLLPVDPVNSDLSDNTIEWDYGICKRRVWTIQGRVREWWIFTESPGADVRIVHNHTGKGLKLGRFAVDDDVEIIPLAAFQLAEYPFAISASLTVYPDAHEETNSVDGITIETTNAAWATMRVAGGDSSSDTDVELYIDIKSTTTADVFDYIYRSHLLFDCSALPAGFQISAAVLSVYGTGKVDSAPWAPDSCIFSSAPASNTAIVPGDHDSVGTTALSNVKTYASFNAGGWNAYTLNATGRAAIIDGVSKFSWYNKNYDADGGTPTWAGNKRAALLAYSADQGGATKPKLVITYTVIAVPTVLTVTPAENITGEAARIKGNVTDTGGENPTRFLQYGKTVSYELGSLNKGVGGTGIYQHDLSGLDAGTLYYFRAYATNSTGTGYGAQADFTTFSDIEEPISVTVEAEVSVEKHLTMPISVSAEPTAEVNKHLTMPISVLAEAEIAGELIIGLFMAISVQAEAKAEVGKTLIMPISVMAEAQIEGALLAGLIKSISVLAEAGVVVGKTFIFPIEALVEAGVVGNFNFQKAISIMAEAEVSATIHLILFSKSDVLINIWNVDKQVN